MYEDQDEIPQTLIEITNDIWQRCPKHIPICATDANDNDLAIRLTDAFILCNYKHMYRNEAGTVLAAYQRGTAFMPDYERIRKELEEQGIPLPESHVNCIPVPREKLKHYLTECGLLCFPTNVEDNDKAITSYFQSKNLVPTDGDLSNSYNLPYVLTLDNGKTKTIYLTSGKCLRLKREEILENDGVVANSLGDFVDSAWYETTSKPSQHVIKLAIETLGHTGETTNTLWTFRGKTGACLSKDGDPMVSDGVIAQPDIESLIHVELGDIRGKVNADLELSEACTHLRALMGQFPFEDAQSAAAGLCILLQPMCKAVVDLNPICVIDAPQPGTGKSLLATSLTGLATGQAVYTITASEDINEFAKRFDSFLIENNGVPLLIDDVPHGMVPNCDAMRAVSSLKNGDYRPRMLGQSRNVAVDVRGVIAMITGNNIVVTADMVRRSFGPRLFRPAAEAALVDDDWRFAPWDIEKARTVLNKVGSNPSVKAQIVSAALTVLSYVYKERQQIEKDQPETETLAPWFRAKPVENYEKWSDLIRTAAWMVIGADPWITNERLKGEDLHAVDTDDFIKGLLQVVEPDQWFELKPIFPKLSVVSDIKHLFDVTKGGDLSIKRVAGFLRKRTRHSTTDGQYTLDTTKKYPNTSRADKIWCVVKNY
ncbi:hypothetical protein [uncultured Roseibium sp.]|uniref:hypothetical protein n=1 Tax=uncultured Roseibium sp. TaxID=1936171 RepID=UPI00321658F4